MKSFKKFADNLCVFDLYGSSIEFYLNEKTRIKTKFGGTLSLCVITVALFVIVYSVQNWASGANYQMISSFESWTYNEMIAENISFPYNFTKQSYVPYFILAAWGGDFVYDFDQLKPYFTQHLMYTPPDQGGAWFEVNMVNCLVKYQDDFLQMSASSDPQYNTTSDWSLCIEDDYMMGLFTDQNRSMVNSTGLSYLITICENTTENNNSCASIEDIQSMVSSISIQISIPDSIYDFRKAIDPRKRTYNNQYYSLSWSMFKWLEATLKPVIVKTDYGLVTEDYKTDTIDYNVENLQSQYDIRSGNRLFQYDFFFGTNMDTYYRKNDKITTILANFGGTLNLLLMAGGILCRTYNFLMMRHKLINVSFRNSEDDDDESKSGKAGKNSTDNVVNDKKFKFSLLSYLFPKHYQTYSHALKNLYEYLDIKNIVKRLQDVDKLKMILFNENQRNVFEIIPKPGIVHPKKKRNSFFSLNSIVEAKNSPYKSRKTIMNINYKKLENDDFTKRMLELIDPKIRMEIELSHGKAIEELEPMEGVSENIIVQKIGMSNKKLNVLDSEKMETEKLETEVGKKLFEMSVLTQK